MTPPTLDEKYDRMRAILRDLESVAVAFSAGVDSTLVLKVAIDTLGPKDVVAVTGRSDSLARAEFEQACALADSLGAEHVILDTDGVAPGTYFIYTTNLQFLSNGEQDRGGAMTEITIN